ncbi:MAG: hypothetical protein AAB781_00440 [Patescibacteria group bacterium]
MNTNNLFLVIAMSRSGHHGVMDWIYEQFFPEKFFFNYCDFSNPDPLFTNRVQYYYNNRKYYAKISDSWIKYGLVEQKLKEFSPETEDIKTKILSADRNLIMMNFENLNSAKLPMTPDQYIERFVPVKNAQHILVIRDIFNFIASRIKSGRELTLKDLTENSARLTSTIELWKTYAREYLGITDYLPQKISVNFNKWFVDDEYRKNLSKMLSVDRDISNWNTVSTYGGGSSFDNQNTNASQMKVLERWRMYENMEAYRNLFLNDKELVSLSERIFGKIHTF